MVSVYVKDLASLYSSVGEPLSLSHMSVHLQHSVYTIHVQVQVFQRWVRVATVIILIILMTTLY